jgi:hypothetical protein
MYVNRFGQRVLAWRLVECVTDHLDPSTVPWLNAQIGAGDLDDALIALVGCCMRHDVVLPTDVAETVRDWAAGYAGTGIAAAFAPYLGETLEPALIRESVSKSCGTRADGRPHDAFAHKPQRMRWLSM